MEKLFNKVIGLLRQYAGGRLFVAQNSYIPPEVQLEGDIEDFVPTKKAKDDKGFDFRRDVIYDQKVEWTEQNTYNDEDE